MVQHGATVTASKKDVASRFGLFYKVASNALHGTAYLTILEE
jgi:hypothetical protein